jgi:hypothetical protein
MMHDVHTIALYGVGLVAPLEPVAPVASAASVALVAPVGHIVLRQLWLHSGFSREPTSANMLAELSHIWL